MSRSPLRRLAGAVRQQLRSRFYVTLGMRGTAPVHPAFGSGVGMPIDRFYIERFLDQHRRLITGQVLEIGDRSYTSKLGTDITASHVLSSEDGPDTTYVGDLSLCPEIPDGTYDCIVLLQTLHYVFDMCGAVSEVHRILKPGGTVLCTVPGISQISRFDMDHWGDRWRLTSLGARELFESVFPAEEISVDAYGNAFSSVCFLQGVPADRLPRTKLDMLEPDYELIVAVCATRPRVA